MLAALIPALAGVAMLGAGVASRQRKDDEAQAKLQQDKQDKDSKFLESMATQKAQQGDHEWFDQNQAGLSSAMSPHVLTALLSEAHNQNARLNSAGENTIPLSRLNQQRQATSGTPGDMASVIAGMNGQMATTPMDQRSGPYYDQLLNTRGDLINAESRATPAAPSGIEQETQQISQLNDQMGEALAPQQAPTPAQPAQPGLAVPPPRKPSSRTLQTAIGSNTQTIPGTTGKEVMSSLISQAESSNLHPNEVAKSFHGENVRRLQAGEPALDFDEAGMKSYREQHWEKTRATIQKNLQSEGMDPQQAFVQSAQLTAQQMPNVPDRWMSVLQPDPEQQANEAYQTAVNQSNDFLSARVKAMTSPAAKGVKPNLLVEEPFLLHAVNSIPGMTPEMHTRVLHKMASTAQLAFSQALQQQYPGRDPMQYNYQAMLLASKATDGDVPATWRAFVEQDMQKLLGLSEADMKAYHALAPFNRLDPFDLDFKNRLSSVRTQMELNTDIRKALLSSAKTPEGVVAAGNAMQGQNVDAFGGVGPAGMKSAAGIGQMERNIAAKQEGVLGQQKQDIERKNAVMPTAHMEKLQSADSLYKAGIEAQKFAAVKDADGKTLVDKYGGQPGTFFDFLNRAKGEFGKQDPLLASYLNRLGMVYNVERHELTGAATSMYEGKTLTPFLPSPNDNIKTGLRKLNGLVKTMADQLDRNLDQAKADYPRSSHDSFYRNQVRKQREAATKKGTQ